MPTFLSDPTFGAYLVLTVFALLFFGAGAGQWLRNRDRRALTLCASTLLLLLALFGIDRAFESPREECVRKVRAMATAANARNWPSVGTHIADKFEYTAMTKAKFLAFVTPLAVQHNATVNFVDFDRDYVEELPGDRMRIGFVSQLTTPGHDLVPMYVEAEFVKEADGAYRMQKFAVYDYITRKKGSEQKLPGM